MSAAYRKWIEENRHIRGHPANQLDISRLDGEFGVAARVTRDKVEPDKFFSWTVTLLEEAPINRRPVLPEGASPTEMLAFANGDALRPAPLIRPKAAPVHPASGHSADEVREKQKREQEEKEERWRLARNRKVPEHLRRKRAGFPDV